jgi:hypothetical protein
MSLPFPLLFFHSTLNRHCLSLKGCNSLSALDLLIYYPRLRRFSRSVNGMLRVGDGAGRSVFRGWHQWSALWSILRPFYRYQSTCGGIRASVLEFMDMSVNLSPRLPIQGFTREGANLYQRRLLCAKIYVRPKLRKVFPNSSGVMYFASPSRGLQSALWGCFGAL